MALPVLPVVGIEENVNLLDFLVKWVGLLILIMLARYAPTQPFVEISA
jgi:hypothetical protein